MTLTRRSLLSTTAAGLAALSMPPRARAATAPYRFKHGAFEIIVVSDGHMVVRTDLLAPGAPSQARAAVLSAAGQTGEQYNSPTNVTLIRTPTELILIDAGAGPNFMPTTGKLPENLVAAGIRKEQISKVILTHAHADHLWGVVDDLDEIQFPNARYFIAAREWDFWMSKDVLMNLPEERHSFVTGAQRSFSRIADKTTRLKGGDNIVPGLRALETPGHSPGHIAIEVAGGDGLIVGGDAITHYLLSFGYPKWPSQGDQDNDLAATTRARLLDRLAADKTRLIGYHLPYPGTGHAERKDGAYRFVAG
jgi:glyoxylase-like metal-dependent hydrolase (beta-lactamase superfamily II)